jgi:hypothetical protein
MTGLQSLESHFQNATPRRRLRLGEILMKAGLLSETQLREGLAHHRAQGGGRLGACLVSLGFISEEALLECLAQQLGLTRVDLHSYPVCEEVVSIIGAEKAREFMVMPIGRVNRHGSPALLVAMTDPTNLIVIDALQFLASCRVEPVLASEEAIATAIDQYYGLDPEGAQESLPPESGAAASWDLLPAVAESLSTEEKFHRLLKILLEKGILSLRDVERLK